MPINTESLCKMNWKEWIEKNCTETQTTWINGLRYMFATMQDGWIAVFRIVNAELEPVIQAQDMAHAKGYCSLIEPVPVPVNII